MFGIRSIPTSSNGGNGQGDPNLFVTGNEANPTDSAATDMEYVVDKPTHVRVGKAWFNYQSTDLELFPQDVPPAGDPMYSWKDEVARLNWAPSLGGMHTYTKAEVNRYGAIWGEYWHRNTIDAAENRSYAPGGGGTFTWETFEVHSPDDPGLVRSGDAGFRELAVIFQCQVFRMTEILLAVFHQ